ncbi:DUF6463 family protein [Microlunatus elymi]|uniref:DUF6463 family protein n=1 Tax=Microlunatus elymi TaxID=2596828 RepID=UPI001AEF9AA0|nr:DUF6463 family protein [Microlunatus elymi]
MNSKTRPIAGIMIIVIGAAHTTLGIVTWISTGPEQRTENFWFTVFGVLAMAFGLAVVELERARGQLPVPVLAGIAAVMLFGVIGFSPLSGFLSLAVPLGFDLARRLVRRRHRRLSSWRSSERVHG